MMGELPGGRACQWLGLCGLDHSCLLKLGMLLLCAVAWPGVCDVPALGQVDIYVD